MFSLLMKVYDFFVTLPERLYPFRCEIEGRFVRGQASYKRALDQAVKRYGPHRLEYKLTIYRGTFHVLGSVLFIIFAALLSKKLLGSEIALYVMVAAAIVALFIQEFYAHPRRFGQLRKKGIIDVAGWVVPMMVYIYFSIL